MKNCTKCRHGALKDYGYSNMTVEGTNFHCLKRENPGITQNGVSYESWENHEESPYNYAELCKEFLKGEPQEFAVEDTFEFDKSTEKDNDW